MIIDSIKLQLLRNGEHLQFNTDVANIVTINNPTALQVVQPLATFMAINTVIENLFKISQGNPITEELQALDLRRDNAINGILLIVGGNGYHKDAVTRNHAKTLGDHLALFGTGIARDNYQSETATLRNIGNDWTNKPELAAAVTALGLGVWQAEMTDANNSFATKYLARTQELATASFDTIKGKRQEITDAYYKLRDRINAYYTINDGAEPYAKTVKELNALIKQYNTLLAGRLATPTDGDTPTQPE